METGSTTASRVANGVNSEWLPVTSGVPQGYVLGPALFNTYINDFDVSASSAVHKFADDMKLYGNVCTYDQTDRLQCDLGKMVNKVADAIQC